MELHFPTVNRLELFSERRASLATSLLRLAGAQRQVSPDEAAITTPVTESDLVLLSEVTASEAVDRATHLIETSRSAALAAYSLVTPAFRKS